MAASAVVKLAPAEPGQLCPECGRRLDREAERCPRCQSVLRPRDPEWNHAIARGKLHDCRTHLLYQGRYLKKTAQAGLHFVDAALHLRPGCADYWHTRGQLLVYGVDDRPQGLQCCLRAAEFDPRDRAVAVSICHLKDDLDRRRLWRLAIMAIVGLLLSVALAWWLTERREAEPELEEHKDRDSSGVCLCNTASSDEANHGGLAIWCGTSCGFDGARPRTVDCVLPRSAGAAAGGSAHG